MGNSTVNVRMNYLSKEVISDCFHLLTEVYNEDELLNSPSRIYNIDETRIALDGHIPQVVAEWGPKEVKYRTTGI